MVKRFMFVLVALLCLCAQASEEVLVKSKPVSATVFISGGAAVTRTGVAFVGKGRTLLKINDLPKAIDFSTLRIKVDGGATVMSVKTAADNNKREINDQIKRVKRQIDRCDSLKQPIKVRGAVVQARIDLLTRNSSFGPQGINDPNTQKAYEMYSKEIESLKGQEYKIGLELAAVEAKRAAYADSVKKLASTKIENKPFALVEVESRSGREVNLELSYRVDNVNWFASYDLRTESGIDNADMLLKANIMQNSGEDWKDVKLRLSTANAAVVEYAPKLICYNIDYGSHPPYESKSVSSAGKIGGYVDDASTGEPLVGVTVGVEGTNIATATAFDGKFYIRTGESAANLIFTYPGYKRQIKYCNSSNNYIRMESDAESPQEVANVAYGKEKAREYSLAGSVAGVKRVGGGREPEINLVNTTEVQNATSMEIEIDGLSSVPSKQEPYSVDVRRYNLPIFYTHVSSPRIEPAAFLQAKVAGLDKLTLLDGELNMFFDNTLINSSVLKRKDIADTTIFAINRDKRVVVRRDAVEGESLHKIEGRKCIVTRNWKYSITNNGNLPILVELSDRVPESVNKEIGVSFASDITPASNKYGILTWRLELKPGQSQQFGLRYVVTYPSNRTVYVD